MSLKSRSLPFALAMIAASPFPSWAASTPFGIATPDSPIGNGVTGIMGPLLLVAIRLQTTFYQKLTAALDAFSQDPWAGPWLIGLSFLYGILHAIGPGHGKAVISSYLLATRESRRRGVLLSGIAALIQAASAIVIISVATLVLDATAAEITRATDDIDILSYGMIVLLGLSLVVSKGQRVAQSWRDARRRPSAFVCEGLAAGQTTADPGWQIHGINCSCDHFEGLTSIAPKATRKDMLTAVISAGIRPCSGALIVLVFALSRHLYPIGIVSVLAMSAGTAATVSLVAILAVGARDILTRTITSRNNIALGVSAHVQFVAALGIFAFGITMMLGTLYG